MEIRESTEVDLKGLLAVNKQAFGNIEGPEVVELVQGLLADPTAEPRLSLVVLKGCRIIGHILLRGHKLKQMNRLRRHAWSRWQWLSIIRTVVSAAGLLRRAPPSPQYCHGLNLGSESAVS
ncbi:MAG: hypothetical protein SVV67_10465 [Bacillota bacterium]|nr:hypothetical protein [Bacillota bacterium]